MNKGINVFVAAIGGFVAGILLAPKSAVKRLAKS